MIVTDELLTKAALNVGCREVNPFFNLLRKKIRERYAHSVITLLGIGLLCFLAVAYNSTVLLLFFGLGFNIPVVFNAAVLRFKVKAIGDKAHQSNID